MRKIKFTLISASILLLTNSAWATAAIATGPNSTTMSGGFVNMTAGTWVNLGSLDKGTKITGRNTTTVGLGVNVRGSLALGGDWVIKRKTANHPLQINVAQDWYGTVDPIADNASIPEEATDNNAHLFITSTWDGTTTDTDTITIGGNVYGYTRIIPRDSAGQAYTSPLQSKPNSFSDDVITVTGTTENEHSFYGVMSTDGAGNLYLVRRDAHHYAWGEVSNTDNGSQNYHPATSGQVSMPKITTELAAELLSSRYQRIGQPVWSQLDQHAQKGTWGRVFGASLRENAKQQLGYESRYVGIQFGHEWDQYAMTTATEAESMTTTTRKGVTAGYVRANAKFYDRHFTDFDLLKGQYASAEHQVGTGTMNMWAVGAYYTKDYATPSVHMKQYIDFAGQVLYAANHQESIDRTTHRAFGFSLSGEYGRHLTQFRGWQAELQGQITFQTLLFSNYVDDNRSIHTPRQFSLRGRAGVRITPVDQTRRLQPYVLANIYREFMSSALVKIGTDKVGDKFAHNWYDVGLGVQYALHQRQQNEHHGAFAYVEGTYSHQLGTWALRRVPIHINAGLRLPYNW